MAIKSEFGVFDDIIKNVDNLMRNVGEEVLRRIVERTPVDTGYAQSQWHLDTDSSSFTVSNQCEYIQYLENGHSQQAPTGMVAVTMNEVPQIIAQELERTKL